MLWKVFMFTFKKFFFRKIFKILKRFLHSFFPRNFRLPSQYLFCFWNVWFALHRIILRQRLEDDFLFCSDLKHEGIFQGTWLISKIFSLSGIKENLVCLFEAGCFFYEVSPTARRRRKILRIKHEKYHVLTVFYQTNIVLKLKIGIRSCKVRKRRYARRNCVWNLFFHNSFRILQGLQGARWFLRICNYKKKPYKKKNPIKKTL